MSLQLPHRDWEYNEWVQYVIDHKDEVFTSKKGKMLKVYYVHANDSAKERLLSDQMTRKQGHFTVISMDYKESASGKSKQSEYWMHEKEPGLLMFFTAATKEGYEETLRHRISSRHGLHEMWIRPNTFENVRKYLTKEKGCGIVKFLADRSKNDPTPHQVKDKAERHIQYRTSNPRDGVNRLEEMQYHLGVTPRSIDYTLNGNRVQITNEGLFHLKTVTKESFELMDDVIEQIRGEEKVMRETAQSLSFKAEVPTMAQGGGILESAKIALEVELDVTAAKQIVKQFKRFAFIEPKIKAGSLIFSSDVVDRQKGSVFTISATEKGILLVPKYKITFETFLEFYKDVVELVDKKATWNKLSDSIEP